MYKRIFTLILLSFVTKIVAQTDTISLNDSLDFPEIDEVHISCPGVIIQAPRPITAKTITSKELQDKNLGQDIPYLLQNTPSVVSTSDAGMGVGYSSMRLRGSDQSRINVTLNGVPVNDAESQGVYWVDLPDLASSTASVVVQRGLGTSSNGTGAFGGSVNINTLRNQTTSFVELNTAYGSFDTQKYTLTAGTGNRGDWNIDGRLSLIQSEGYVDRASSKLWSYALNTSYKKHLKLNVIGGYQKTYQAWYGIDKKTLETNRTYNPAGEIYDALGDVIGFYDNQTDNYQQHNFQLHYDNIEISKWTASATVHYTFGQGYYEEYKNQVDFSEYNVNSTLIDDLIRQKWLKNNFFGAILNANRYFGPVNVEIGLLANQYIGEHYGKVIATPHQTNIVVGNEYYNNEGVKSELAAFTKLAWRNILPNINAYIDLQIRQLYYETSADLENSQEDFVKIDKNLTFFNPKMGLEWKKDAHKIYSYYGIGHREPNRDDYMSNPDTKPEQMQNAELGYQFKNKSLQLNANLYGMWYENQLVLTGAINDVGTPIRENSGKSYRMGIELEADYSFSNAFSVGGNVSLSRNKNVNYIHNLETAAGSQFVSMGYTDISFSPTIITNGYVTYKGIKNLSLTLSGRYVGEQYMSNAEYAESKLSAYGVGDFSANYTLPKHEKQPEVTLMLLVNNILNRLYESNGYYYNYYDGNAADSQGLNHNPYYYPQAGRNYMAGVRVRF